MQSELIKFVIMVSWVVVPIYTVAILARRSNIKLVNRINSSTTVSLLSSFLYMIAEGALVASAFVITFSASTGNSCSKWLKDICSRIMQISNEVFIWIMHLHSVRYNFWLYDSSCRSIAFRIQISRSFLNWKTFFFKMFWWWKFD